MILNMPKISSYQIQSICPIYERFKPLSQGDVLRAVSLTVSVNGNALIYLVCEDDGGAYSAWFENPNDNYIERIDAVFRDTATRTEAGYECCRHGMFDQYVFTVDSFLDNDDGPVYNSVEYELFLKAHQIFETLLWSFPKTTE